MQYINFNKIIELEDKIQDLLLISIDDKIENVDDKDGVRISGNITISGKAKMINGEKSFSDCIDLEMFLAYEEIEERKDLNANINDFNYKIEDNKLNLEISVSIDGLKEITTTFPSKEDNESFLEEEIEEDIDDQVEENEEIETFHDRECDEETIIEERIEEDNNDIEKAVEEIKESKKMIKEERIEKKSLLKSVFTNKRIKEEVSWKLHCVKKETTYEEIAKLYNVNVFKLKTVNKNEKLTEGKLVFIPLE